MRITIWDTLGAVSKEAAIKTFYKKATVAIIVCSVDRSDSFKSVDKFIEDLNEYN